MPPMIAVFSRLPFFVSNNFIFLYVSFSNLISPEATATLSVTSLFDTSIIYGFPFLLYDSFKSNSPFSFLYFRFYKLSH